MLKITPIPALADNYIWLLQQGNEAVCIDPGDTAPVAGYLKAHGLMLRQIWITHHHADHIAGLPELIRQFPDCPPQLPAASRRASPALLRRHPLFRRLRPRLRRHPRPTLRLPATHQQAT